MENGVLEDSLQDVLQADATYDNVHAGQHHVYEMSSESESENVAKCSGCPYYSTIRSLPRHESQVSHNPACHNADGAASIATTKSTTKSKLAPTATTE